MTEWQEGCASGEITEVFACGTAAVITPVGAVRSAGADWTIGDGTPGPVATRLREELVGIQNGTRPGTFRFAVRAAWSCRVTVLAGQHR